MKIVWTLVALFLACLAGGGILTGLSGSNGGGVFDLLIGALLGWAAWGVWKNGVAARSPRTRDTNKSDRPWRR